MLDDWQQATVSRLKSLADQNSQHSLEELQSVLEFVDWDLEQALALVLDSTTSASPMFSKFFKHKQSVSPVLNSPDLASLVEYIESDKCNKIVVMLGAGVSTAAGIPDFRSPDTGLYANLQRLNLPYPEAVFEINFFRKNPMPFFTLAQELYPGRYRPTLTHSFVKLLADKGLLLKCFTQNIDTLERQAGLPDDLIIEAHGSFANQRCIDCHKEYDSEEMRKHIKETQIPKCKSCNGLVKPDIVFFGESLPKKFLDSIALVSQADLLIVMGTSLTVHPFAALASLAEEQTPRVLINMDSVGDFGARSDDVVLLGKCDDVVNDLATKLGWEKDLKATWEETKLPEEEMEAKEVVSEPGEVVDTLKDAKDEVQKIADMIGKVQIVDEKEGTRPGRPRSYSQFTEEEGPKPDILQIPPKTKPDEEREPVTVAEETGKL